MTDYEALSKHVVDLLIANSCMGEKIKEQDIKIANYENAFNRILLRLQTNGRIPKAVFSDVIDIIDDVNPDR